MNQPVHGANDTLRAFDAKLATHSMRGQWSAEPMLQASIGGPQPAGKPYLWSWSLVETLLAEAGAALPESMESRRSLLFNNPGLQIPSITQTMNMGFQQILPGETAWTHRHSITALRFIVEGSPNAKTVVAGEPCPMEDFDLILTPSWTWHDHHNKSAKPVTWIDVLDIPLARALNQIFYQPYGAIAQPETPPAERVGARLGMVRPVWETQSGESLPVRYPWRDVEPRLKALLGHNGSPHDGIALEYVNPVTGGSTLLPGMTELAEEIMGVPVRRGVPRGIGGLVDVVKSPVYATGVGLVVYGARHQDRVGFRIREENVFKKVKRRMGEWLQEVF